MSKLEKTLDVLIADELGISPGDVTLEMIQSYRRDHVDPNENFDFSTSIGGLNPPTRHVFTRAQIEFQRKQAEEFFKRSRRKRSVKA